MSDLTPPKYWETQGRADYWLERFIKEVDGPARYQDLFRLPPLVFDTIRDGWKTKIVLKQQFAEDPDALAEFIRYERKPPWAREMEQRIREEMEAADEECRRAREEMREECRRIREEVEEGDEE